MLNKAEIRNGLLNSFFLKANFVQGYFIFQRLSFPWSGSSSIKVALQNEANSAAT